MGNILDIFNNDEFQTVSLTDLVLKRNYVPTQLGDRGIFEDDSVNTKQVAIEELDGQIGMTDALAWGSPATQIGADDRDLIPFMIQHRPIEAQIMAAELMGLRAPGSADQTQAFQAEVLRRSDKLFRTHDYNAEYARANAIQGLVKDTAGNTKLNVFNSFGKTEQTVNLDTDTQTAKVLSNILKGVEMVEDALGAETYDRIEVWHSKDSFKKLVEHKGVKEAYERWQNGAFLRDDNRYTGFEFPRNVFHFQYRGKTPSGAEFIPAGTCRFVPVGTPGLFKTYYAPADFIEYVGTPGLQRYAKIIRRPDDRGVTLHTQSNFLSLCTRPEVLVKGTVA